ncbi:NADH-quinone oxidoreductase subunit B family protein [Chromobacterium phragmitis]|uniref:NADH-quinone oxidoreductase subunit B family protein n=2 Tax=Chromobacterium amazonense TaxID=1382803 RepID=A0ABU8V387_9NEIS|nr:NADH-quinone oxidoreductase subunit B family protein [Chromobacterium amazonense]MBM2883700.1 NADH-quinone oxidoreductase subunit B family protein [Chromobacterium amazonense]MDE1711626.1 NADH-quinone oxidoreductase subunit B family protein [Chromobacterium amazonense]MDQ4542724.1 NADH-quinone oxidoreductase subunit B family protein [Chromobacterium amazonense]
MIPIQPDSKLIIPRDEYGMPKPLTESEGIAHLKQKLLKDIQRSAYVYRVDCGGCNGCEIEIFAAITPVFDAERFGIKVVASPRHADILLFTGAVTRAMRMPALRAWQAAPDPKISVSYGACGCSGGIFHDLYCVWGGSDKIVPVDVYIPGCPPTPAATIYGFAMALGLLEQKLHASHQVEGECDRALLPHPRIPLDTRVRIEREARRLAGYRSGRLLADQFMDLASQTDSLTLDERVKRHLSATADPRENEIFTRLWDISMEGGAR